MNVPSTVQSAGDIRTDYMKLLVTQLQNQDPTEPMDNYQMAAQLTQFSQLEQLESMNKNFSQVLDSIQQTYARSLLGKEVAFVPKNSPSGVPVKGVVDEVDTPASGDILLGVGSYQVTLADIVSVRNPLSNPQMKL